MKELSGKISNWLFSYLLKSNLDCFVVGISGGIDSALVSTLCAKTGKRTLVVSMPIHQNSEQLNRAKKHAAWLKIYSNVTFFEYDLTETFDNLNKLLGDHNKLASANTRSRLRMATLYHIATLNKGLVVGTGNKVEDFGVGFFTKYGDGGVDISPIGDLTKTEVRLLAKELGIINDILFAKPSDGLWDDGRTDEEQLGASYEELEWAMDWWESGKYTRLNTDVLKLSTRQIDVLKLYQKLNDAAQHKINPIPVFTKPL
jgi:NAD+ synthase